MDGGKYHKMIGADTTILKAEKVTVNDVQYWAKFYDYEGGKLCILDHK